MNYETVEGLKEILEFAVGASVKLDSKVSKEVAELRGMSSPRIRHFLNQLCSYGGCTYLEIGTWAGSTLIPSLWKNDNVGMAIDNWTQFTKQEMSDGFDAREALTENLVKFGADIKKAIVVNDDCFNYHAVVQAAEITPNVFFYDGNHDAPSTQRAIETYGRICHQPFILLVDDWSLTPSVKFGTNEALKKFKVHFSQELRKDDGYHEGVMCYILESA